MGGRAHFTLHGRPQGGVPGPHSPPIMSDEDSEVWRWDGWGSDTSPLRAPLAVSLPCHPSPLHPHTTHFARVVGPREGWWSRASAHHTPHGGAPPTLTHYTRFARAPPGGSAPSPFTPLRYATGGGGAPS